MINKLKLDYGEGSSELGSISEIEEKLNEIIDYINKSKKGD